MHSTLLRPVTVACLTLGLISIQPQALVARQDTTAAVAAPQGPAGQPAAAAQEAAPSQAASPTGGARAEADAALGRLDEIRDRLTVLIGRATAGVTIAEMDLLRLEALELVDESRDLLSRIPRLLTQIEDDGGDGSEVRARLGGLLAWFNREYAATQDRQFAVLDSIGQVADTVSADNLAALDVLAQETRQRIRDNGFTQIELLEQAAALGFDVTEEFAEFDRVLLERVDDMADRVRLRVVHRDREKAKYREARQADLGEAQLQQARRRVLSADERLAGAAGVLRTMTDLLKRRGYPTVDYQILVAQATGDVTGDLLNPRVLLGLTRGWVSSGLRWLRTNGLTLVAQFIYVLAIVWVFRSLFRILWWILEVTRVLRMPRLASDLLGRSLLPLATIVGLLVGLAAVGVDSTALLTGLGVVSLIVGLALQDSLSNLASGLFILAHRPYDVDDVIEAAGLVGRVKALGLANTELLTLDNRQVFVPNRRIWGDVIANRSTQPTRRVEVEISVADREDLDRVFTLLHTVMDENEHVLKDPAPLVYLKRREESWRVIELRAWVKTEHWFKALSTLPGLVDRRFAQEGIRPSAPRREIVRVDGGTAGGVEPSREALD